MELNVGRKKGRIREKCPEATENKDTHAENLLIGHDLMVIYRLIEMHQIKI